MIIQSSLECLQQGRDTGFIPFMSVMFVGCLFYGVGIICVLRTDEDFDELKPKKKKRKKK